MSVEKGYVCDEHKFPFSLVSEFKHGHNREILKTGDVSELMDKSIGRLVFRIKGSVSANNFIEFDSLNLVGPVLHIQMCLTKPNIATLHLEVLTTTNIPLRLTLSTLYHGDQPRFLGRSLRLPLPTMPGWMVLAIDLNKVLSTYCVSSATAVRSPPPQLQTIKKIQLCSNMLVRDLVTSDHMLSPRELPTELLVKPLPASQGLQFVDLMEVCANIPESSASPELISKKLASLSGMPAPSRTGVAFATNAAAAGSHSGGNNSPAKRTSSASKFGTSNVTGDASAAKSTTSALFEDLPVPPTPSLANMLSSTMQTPQVGMPQVPDGSRSMPSKASFRINVSNISTTATDTAGVSTVTATVLRESMPEQKSSTPTAKRLSRVSSEKAVTGPSGATATAAPTLKDMGLSTVAPPASPAPAAPQMAVASTPAPSTAAKSETSAATYTDHTTGATEDDFYSVQRSPAPSPGDNLHRKYAPSSVVGAGASQVPGPQASGTVTGGGSGAVADSRARQSGVTLGTVLSKAMFTPRHIPLMQVPSTVDSNVNGASNYGSGVSPSTAGYSTVKYSVPDTQPADRVLLMERLLGYSGGPAVLLYEGRMLLLPTGSLLVMVDLDKESKAVPKHGLFRAFRSITTPGTSVAANDKALGFKQSFLRGHNNPVGLIEVSEKEALMVTGETSTSNGQLILWDLREGKRLATLRPHLDLLQAASFSTDCAMLVTIGTDLQFRQQIVVWDIAQLISEKAVNITNKTAALVAKQISEFPVQKIRFSPFEEFSLVSCGRENIRFWRIRKGHLPGRPVLLNEYARGYTFQDIAFHSDAGATPRDPRRPTVYVASNRGLVLRINCQTDQIICAYQLHSCSIRTLCIHSGYAVTGAEDNKLRLWPLDFNDFLLEAKHEGEVTNIRIALDGRKLSIGTTAGTLGVLNVSEHSYSTVLRSHSHSVTDAMPCLFGPRKGQEFATVGKDNTVRIWDAVSGNQVIEFTSEKDQPTCCVYHPNSDRYIACGYQSGYLRLFETTTATAALEIRCHTAAVVCARYINRAAHAGGGDAPANLMLATASLDGSIIIHDANEGGGYLALKRISFGSAVESMMMEVSEDSNFLVVGSGMVGSIAVFETRDFSAQLRLATSSTSGSGPSGNSPVPGASTEFPTAMVQSTTYNNAATVNAAAPGSSASNGAEAAAAPATPAVVKSAEPIANIVSPDRRATVSSASNAVNSSTASSGTSALHAPLVGFCFAKDRAGGGLLIATDKHFISVALTGAAASIGASKKQSNAWEERLSKRLECGIPTSMTKDPSTGLLFMAMRAPLQPPSAAAKSGDGAAAAGTGAAGRRSSMTSAVGTLDFHASSSVGAAPANAGASATFRSLASTAGSAPSGISANTASSARRAAAAAVSAGSGVVAGTSAAKLSDVANSFAVIDVKHRSANSSAAALGMGRKEKLSVSVPQLYQDLSAAVQGVCPCVEANKVITVDASGSITIWHLKSSNLVKVKVDLSAPSPSAHLREYRNNSNEDSRFAASAGASTGVTSVASAESAEGSNSRITDAMFDACDSPDNSPDLFVPPPISTAGTDATTSSELRALPGTPNTQALTKDFERAVMQDPSVWSANSSATPNAASVQPGEGADQVRSDLYQHNISSPAAKAPSAASGSRSTSAASSPRAGSVASLSTVASASKVPTAAGKIRQAQAGKAAYVKPPQNLNTSTASYDIMFHEDGALTMEGNAEDGDNAEHAYGVAAPTLMDMSFNSSVQEANLSNFQQSHRPSKEAAPVPSTPRTSHTSVVPSSVPIDNPLAGLGVWMEMQSPVSSGKARQGGAGAGASSFGYDSAEEEAEVDGQTSEEQARQMDTLDLLQRARANMNASRLGATASVHAATAATSADLPLTYYTEVEAAQQSNLYTINHGNAVAPSYCQPKSLMLCSDGSGIMVKYINTGDQMLLGFPAPLAYCRSKCAIIEARLHESGNMVASLVRCVPSNAYYLVAWVLVGGGDIDDGTFVPCAVEWRCMGFADIGVVDNTSHTSGASTIKGLSAVASTNAKPSVCLEWMPSGALLVLTSQDSAASSAAHLGNNGLVKLTLIPPEVIYAGDLSLNWDDINQVVQSPLGRVVSVRSLPGVVVDLPHKDMHSQIPTVHVMLVGESRVMMVSLTVHKKMAPGAQSDLAHVVWSDDLGARGPIIGMDTTQCSSSNITRYDPSAAHSKAKASSSSATASVAGPEGTDSLVAVLDSCGSVKFSVFSFYTVDEETGIAARNSALFARSVTTKVPAANASGALRTLSLFPPQTRRASHFMALAATHDVRLFTLSLRELNAKSISVNLTVLYKISLDCAPDYLLCLKPIAYGESAALSKKLLTQMGPAGQAPHLLVSNTQGYTGFVPNARWVSGRHLPSACLTLQSPPLHCPAGTTLRDMIIPSPSASGGATSAEAVGKDVVVALTKGHVQLFHSKSGIKLPFGGYSGISYGTSLTPLGGHCTSEENNSGGGMFAVGSRCGRVALFDAASMQQQELVTLVPVSTVSPLPTTTTAATALFKKSTAGPAPNSPGKSYAYTSAAGSAVMSLRPAVGGTLLMAAQESGEVSVIHVGGCSKTGKASQLASIFTPSLVTKLPTPLYQQYGAENSRLSADRMQNPHQHCTVLASCVGEDRLLGVIRRHSNILELYFREVSGPLHNFMNVSLKTPSDLDVNTEGTGSAYFPTAQPVLHEASANISVSACHVIVSDRTYVISLVGRMTPHPQESFSDTQAAASPVYLFSGSVTLPDVPAATARAVLAYTRAVERNSATPAIDVTPYLTTLRQRVLLDEQPAASSSAAATVVSEGVGKRAAMEVCNSHSFSGRHCAIATADMIYVLDLLKVYTSPPGSEVSHVCVTSVAAQVTMIGGTAQSSTWADSVLLLSPEEEASEHRDTHHTSSAQAQNSEVHQVDRSLTAKALSLVVFRKHKAAMLKFRIKC